MAATFTSPALPGDIRLMNATAGLLAALGVAGLIGLALAWVLRLPVFALHGIQIEGDVTRNSVSTIRANATPKLAGNFFTMDMAAGRRAFEAVPWVRRAEVRRVWPNRLEVHLEEHRPAAFWDGDAGDEASASNSGDKLVDTFGDVFEANLGDVDQDQLPTLRGPEGSAVHMLQFLARLEPVMAPMKSRVEALALSGRGSWHVELESGAEVELGRGSDDEVLARAQRFVATLPELGAMFQNQHPLEYADLRHNDAYAVRLKGVTTTPELAGKPAKK